MCEELHDPFADQVACARYRAERDALAQRMEEVASEIDRTLLGVEGIEDAPAMRWARGLRETLGALHSPRTSYEDIEAARWVREHGGLDEVKRHYFATCALSGDLAEWKREVYELCERIGVRHEDCEGEADMLREAYKVLDRRLMPEGMEWPRYEDGSPVLLGDATEDSVAVRRISFTERRFYFNSSHRKGIKRYRYGERVKRPAVIGADGEPLEAGQTVRGVEDGKEFEVVNVNGELPLLKYGETAYTATEPEHLTHQRPDSWERLEEDAMLSPHSYICACGKHDDAMPKSVQMSIDLVRRAKALAERGE